MKPNPPTKQAARLPKLPKARAVTIVNGGRILGPGEARYKMRSVNDIVPDYTPGILIPTRTVTEARALIRVAGFFAMGEAEQIEAAVRAADAACKKTGLGNYRNIDAAKAVLTLIASGGARK